jgi:hypothetical protein
MRCMQHPQEVIHEIVWARKFILFNDAQIKCSGRMHETVDVREDNGDIFLHASREIVNLFVPICR